MIDGGTFQVGLTVMYFIVSDQQRRGVDARLAGDDLGRPHRLAVLDDLQRVVGDVEDDVGVVELRLAERRGIQRQRSMLTRTVSIWRSRFGEFIALTVWLLRTPVASRPARFWNLRTAAATVSS